MNQIVDISTAPSYGALDRLLRSFVEQQRMKLPGSSYQPCYTIRTPGG